ncbi:MAG: TonB family protein [Bacteroidota bacterium]|jgi:hypothetical protein|nr:TonB family protein [Bacteroidota bacterium]
MSKELKHTIYNPGDCISEQTMFDYIDNMLSAKAQHVVEKHVLDCEFCADALEGLKLVKNRDRIKELNTAVRSRMGKTSGRESMDRRTILSIAAGVLLLIGGVFIFRQFTKNKQEDIAELKTSSESLKEKENSTLKEDSIYPPNAKEEKPIADEPLEIKGKIQSKLKAADNESSIDANQSVIAEPKVISTEETVADELSQAENKYSLPDQDAKKQSEVSDKTVLSAPQNTLGNSAPAMSGKDLNNAENKRDDISKTSSEQANDNVGGYYDLESMTKSSKKNAVTSKEKEKREEKKEITEKPSAAINEDIAFGNTNTVAYSWQSDSTIKADEQIFTIVDEMPKFPGGNSALEIYIADNSQFVITKEQSDKTIPLQFVISSSGQAVNAKSPMNIDNKKKEELEQLIKRMPAWEPGKLNGKKVPVFYNINLKLR